MVHRHAGMRGIAIWPKISCSTPEWDDAQDGSKRLTTAAKPKPRGSDLQRSTFESPQFEGGHPIDPVQLDHREGAGVHARGGKNLLHFMPTNEGKGGLIGFWNIQIKRISDGYPGDQRREQKFGCIRAAGEQGANLPSGKAAADDAEPPDRLSVTASGHDQCMRIGLGYPRLQKRGT